MHRFLFAVAGFIGVLLSNAAMAEVRLPKIFGDHMVIQREQPTVIWGWAEAGEKVSVDFAGSKGEVTAGADGKWQLKVTPPTAVGPHELTVTGKNSIKLTDVLVGEVWLCSGQSNMEWTVEASDNPQEEIANAKHPRIRHIKIQHTPAEKPLDDLTTDGWTVCSPETAAKYTAVGYYFARNLQQALDVPVGIIGSNWGGTRIEPWTPPEGFKQVAELKDIANNLDKFPMKNANGQVNHQTALALYNGMIHPMVPYAIRGALWYQGESNNGEGMLYRDKMKALISGWRSVWQREDMPFYFVQLAPYKYSKENNRVEYNLPGIWEAQAAALEIPNTGMAVTVDIGNTKDIHPKNKQEVGRRLSLWALAKTYGKQVAFSGPLYESHAIEGDKVRIRFKHVGGGLVARDSKPLSNFEIAGEDGKFVAATATIEDGAVVVKSEQVAKPTAVRYGWHEEAEPNLSNQEGLPASPFRTKAS